MKITLARGILGLMVAFVVFTVFAPVAHSIGGVWSTIVDAIPASYAQKSHN